jgi:exodeoxyribonuclease VII large subunit
VLARGYSVTMCADGEVVRDAASLAIGDLLKTRLQRGDIVSRVEATITAQIDGRNS